MIDLLESTVSGANILPTILLLFVIIYWLIVLIGLLDLSTLDVDVDVDMDADASSDINTDAGSISGGAISFNAILIFFNLGYVPLMIFMSFVALPHWFMSYSLNQYLGLTGFLPGLLVVVPSFILSLLIAKVATLPLAKLFKASEADDNFDIIGKTCTMLTTATDQKAGQAEMATGGAPIRISVIATPGSTLERGGTAMIIENTGGQNIYLADPN